MIGTQNKLIKLKRNSVLSGGERCWFVRRAKEIITLGYQSNHTSELYTTSSPKTLRLWVYRSSHLYVVESSLFHLMWNFLTHT